MPGRPAVRPRTVSIGIVVALIGIVTAIGPAGPAAAATSITVIFDDLRFRLLYDRVFALEFFVALLQAMHA